MCFPSVAFVVFFIAATDISEIAYVELLHGEHNRDGNWGSHCGDQGDEWLYLISELGT
jgi:hypothetical protein